MAPKNLPSDAGRPEPQLPPKEAAAALGMSESWLAKARVNGDGPPYSKVGRSVRYSPSDLARWLRSHKHLSTSEYERYFGGAVDHENRNEDEE